MITYKHISLKKIFIRRDVQLFFLLFLIYIVNIRPIIGDADVSNYVSISIIKEGDFDLDEFVSYNTTGRIELKSVTKSNGHVVSIDDVGGAILAAPLFLIPVVFGISSDSWLIPFLGKIAAAILVALSALFLYYTLKKLTKEKYALFITLIYALATTSWSISSQGLWPHGPSQFSLTLALYFLVRGLKEKKYIIYSGFPLAFAVVCRSTNFLILIIFSIYVLHKHKDKFLKFASFALLPLIFLIIYNYHYFGFLLPFAKAPLYLKPELWKNNFFEGFFGQLISPSRGLFIYSPVLIFSLYGIYKSWKKSIVLFCYSTIAIFVLICFYSYFKIWYGGHSWGPRYLADVLPFFSLLLVPAIEEISKRKIIKVIFILFFIISLFIQIEGILFFNGTWHAKYDTGPENHLFLWSINNTQIMYYLKNPNNETLKSYEYVFNNLFK